jgi:hypothetical protein
MPPLLKELGLWQDKRRGPGNRYTPPPATTPRRLHRLSQSPAGRLPRPAGPNLPGLVIPENIVAIRRPPMPAAVADGTEAAEAWIWNSHGARAAGWICGSPLFRDGAAGCLEVG